MKSKIFIMAILLTVLAVAVGGYLVFFKEPEARFSSVQIGNKVFEVEIADTSIAQMRGLSGREPLDENQGMLFVFDKPSKQSFWMMGMKFPLDIIWISGDTIVGIEKNAPIPSGISIPIFYSPENVDKVLEINAGLADSKNIKVGDKLIY